MAGLTTSGFESKTLEEILAEMETDARAELGDDVNTEADSVLGVLLGLKARQLAQLWELMQAVHAAQYPDTASGFALTQLSALTGTQRRAATRSTVTATINIDDGESFVAGDLVAHVDGDPTARFELNEAFSNSSGSAADFDVEFIAEETGPIRANAGTLTEIAEAVTGWNSITNAADATLGEEEETDEELRIRREVRLAARGSATVEAIRADVLEVDSVTACDVFENASDTVDGDGVPPHAIEVVVSGGADADVAEAIFNSKPAGIEAHGDTTETVEDEIGSSHTIGFTRPTVQDVYIEVDVTVDADTYGGDTAVKEALADYGDEFLEPGDDVIASKLIAVVFDVAGVLDVTALRLGFSASPSGTANLTIGSREVADLDTGRIVVAS